MTSPVAGHCPSCGRTFAKASGHCPNDGTRIVAAAPQAQDGLVGRVLDMKYEIRGVLANGRIGAMFLGWQMSVAREVAIKVIHPTFTEDRGAAGRFADAAKLACQLAAPTIANTYDFGHTSDGIVYVVSELVRGRSLDGETRRGTIPARRIVGIAVQICDALDAAHRLSALHGDLKPSNVLIDESSNRDVIKVIDFGLSRALVPNRTDPRRGLPLYTAPELLDGGAGDIRSDLYSLGCVVHELIVGSPPFQGATIEAVASRHRNELPPALPPNVPADLVAITRQLLAKSPGDRFATCKNLRARLVGLQSVIGAPTDAPRTRGSNTNTPYVSRDPTTPPTSPSQGPWQPRDPTTPPTGPSQGPWQPRDPTTPPTGPSQGPWQPRDPTTPPSVGPSQGPWQPRDPTTPPTGPSYYPPRDPTTPPTGPSYPPYVARDPTTPPTGPSYPPFVPHDPTTPPSVGPHLPPPVPAESGGGGRRVLVIALVAIVVSAAGIGALVLLS